MSDAWSLNLTVLIGRVGRDAEVKTSKGNNPVKYAYFTVATHQKFSKNRKKTSWHNVTAWSPKLAEFCGNFVRKGMLVVVVGRNDPRTYKTPAGEERTVTDVRAEKVLFVEKREDPPETEPEEETAKPQEDESEYF